MSRGASPGTGSVLWEPPPGKASLPWEQAVLGAVSRMQAHQRLRSAQPRIRDGRACTQGWKVTGWIMPRIREALSGIQVRNPGRQDGKGSLPKRLDCCPPAVRRRPASGPVPARRLEKRSFPRPIHRAICPV